MIIAIAVYCCFDAQEVDVSFKMAIPLSSCRYSYKVSQVDTDTTISHKLSTGTFFEQRTLR